MIGAETLPTTSSTSSATPSGRGCRDGEEGRSASRSVRRPATKRSRRSARRSEAGPFTNAATRRWMIWRACSMRISAAGSTTTGGSTRRLSTRPYGASTSFWRDGPTGSSSPCAGTRHEPFTGCNASRAARLACCSLGLALWTRPNNGSRMTRECHVRFCESAGVRSPRATHRNIYVRSRRAGERVMASVSRFLTNRLRLKVKAKSAVARPEERKFLGFSISNDGSKRRIAPKALDTFKGRVRDMTRRTRGFSLQQSIKELKPYIVGWRGYFGFCQTPRVLTNLEAWIRRRLRLYLWRQWRTRQNRFAELRRRGVARFAAAVAAGSPTGLWRMSGHPAVQQALRNAYFELLGLPRIYAPAQA